MELRHIRYFLMVARHQHFTRAAKALYISQPSLTQQIQQLERELGVQLFQRTKRSVELTTAGAAFLEHAERILSATVEAQAAMQSYAEQRLSVVTLGMLTSLQILRMPTLVRRFHEIHPSIKIEMREGLTDELAEMLRMQQVESIIICTMDGCTPSILRDSAFMATELVHEELGVLVNSQHALATKRVLTWDDLAGIPLVAMNPGSGLRTAIMQHSREAGFTPTIAYESGDIGTICALVAEGLGAALVPHSVVRDCPPEIRYIPFRAPPPRRSIRLVWPQRELSPATAAWVTFLQTTLPMHEHDSG
jgi:DNA-binding transcriptional LysR family regulator